MLDSADSNTTIQRLSRKRCAAIWLSPIDTTFEHVIDRVIHDHLRHALITTLYDFVPLSTKRRECVRG